LRTRELPSTFGAVFFTLKASSDLAYRTLVEKIIAFYRDALFNPHWGEQIAFNPGNTVRVSMVFQGLGQQQSADLWAPFLAWARAHAEYTFEKPFQCLALPAQHFWDGEFLAKHAPGFTVADQRPGAHPHHVLWKGDLEQAGWFIPAYKSAWMPASLLPRDQQATLADAIVRCTRHWPVAFHFNKGLAGAPAADIEAARDTAMNPGTLDAFALAIVAGGEGPRYPGMPGADADNTKARHNAGKIAAGMAELMTAAPGAGSYVSESDYFLANWQGAFWGSNYTRLAQIKKKYDPDGLFFVHHGVGSEAWSADGFTPLRN
jgi:hypothetical protein